MCVCANDPLESPAEEEREIRSRDPLGQDLAYFSRPTNVRWRPAIRERAL